MIDGQHPIHVGLFPMDIKCHTPQQLRQIQQQQQQQQQQQHQHQNQQAPQQSNLLINGNAEMLTASIAATGTTTIAALNGRNGKCVHTASATMTTSSVSESTTTSQQPTTISIQRISATTTAATTSAITTTTTTSLSSVPPSITLTDTSSVGVNGSCSSNNNNHDKTIVSVKCDGPGLGLGTGAGTVTVTRTLTPSTSPHNSIKSSTTKILTALAQQTINGIITTNQQASHQARNMSVNIRAATAEALAAAASTASAIITTTSTAIQNTLTSVSDCMMLENCTNNSNIVSMSCGPHCITTEQNNNNASNIIQQQQQQQQLQHHQKLQMHLVNAKTPIIPHHYTQQQQHTPHHHHHQPHLHHNNHQHHQMTLDTHSNNGNNPNCNGIAIDDVMPLQIRLPCGGGGGGGGVGVGGVSGRMRSIGIDNAAACNTFVIGTGTGTGNLALSECGYCCQPICDRYIMRVVDTSFHESCLKCATCSLHLVYSCFARDGKLYCRIDYERLFLRNRCLGCGHKIASDELVMRALENVFHLKCFACVVCGSLLKKGEQYVVKQGQLFCRFDYEKEVEMLQGYDFYGDDLFPPKLDGRRGPKRPRTILNTQQRRAFKASFEVSPKPCRKVRENLAKETGLSLRIVQVWFQNQRAKVKKIQKKAKQEHPKGTSDSQDSQESDSSMAKVKDEAPSDNESLLESPYFSCTSASSTITTGNAASNAESISKLRCIKDENENAPFNCMETDKENCNKNSEPILNTILGLSYATFQQLMGPFTQSPMVNPIDRLYSMQNSYFRPDELNYADCGKELAEN